jgi:hypothetical protein
MHSVNKIVKKEIQNEQLIDMNKISNFIQVNTNKKENLTKLLKHFLLNRMIILF